MRPAVNVAFGLGNLAIGHADRISFRPRNVSALATTGAMAMKLSIGWMISAGVIVATTAAGAQTLSPNQNGVSPYSTASDVDRPYAAMPPDSMPPRYAPPVLPPREVYSVVRESGYAPLGPPQQRGLVYTIAVIDPNGDDGRLVIDARDGRIIRFMPAYRMGDRMGDEGALSYGSPGPLPPVPVYRGVPRPPASVPRVASRSPAGGPLPKAMPRAVAEPKPPAPLAATPAPVAAPVRQSAVVPPKSAEATPPAAATAALGTKPSVPILPTQAMPKAQGLD
jgi:hypothetical protein